MNFRPLSWPRRNDPLVLRLKYRLGIMRLGNERSCTRRRNKLARCGYFARQMGPKARDGYVVRTEFVFAPGVAEIEGKLRLTAPIRRYSIWYHYGIGMQPSFSRGKRSVHHRCKPHRGDRLAHPSARDNFVEFAMVTGRIRAATGLFCRIRRLMSQ